MPDLLDNGSGNTFPSFDEGGSIYKNGDDKNPGAIMHLSPHPQSGLNPNSYPVDPKSCQPITPWNYLKVNTIFQVIHKAGLRTAWSDKHAVYSSFNGPGSNGMSIDDFFAPEIDSQAVGRTACPTRPTPLGARRCRDQAVRRLQGPGRHQRAHRI